MSGATLTEESMNSFRVRLLVLLLGMLSAVTLMATSASAATTYQCAASGTVIQSCSPGLKPVTTADSVTIAGTTFSVTTVAVPSITLTSMGTPTTFTVDAPAIPAVTQGAFAALAGLLLLGSVAFIMRSRKAGLRGGASA
jgi:hypothetical protein